MKYMSITNLVTAIIATILFCGCGSQKTKHKRITPLPAGITVEHLQDCTIPVAFTPDDFHWMGGNLSLTVYNQDLYDVVDISQMQVGDTIIYAGEPMVINRFEERNGGIDINGGLDEGGCCLAPNEGGTYVARDWDDHATYTKLGKTEVALAEDFIIIDCGEFPEDPNDTIRHDQKRYLENLKSGRDDFFPQNTRVTIENGMVTEIQRRWIP